MMLRFTFRALAATSLLALTAPALADTLVDDVDGVTIDAEGKVLRFTGIVFDDDGKVTQVLARGDKRPQVDYRLDGEGRVMIPGMIDAHVHVGQIGFAAMTLDLSDTASLDEALQKIAQFAADNPGRPWILGRGWNQEKWGLGRFPTAAELDAVVSDRPVLLDRADGHAAWANSFAMKQAGITAAAKAPAGGQIIRDAKGNPTGIFVDAAISLVGTSVPAPRPADFDRALALAQERLIANGVTAVGDMAVSIEEWHAYRRAPIWASCVFVSWPMPSLPK